MNERDVPTATDDPSEVDDEPVADTELDVIADDLDTVEAAMKALDADDFDRAEALAASLIDDSVVDAEPSVEAESREA